MVRRRMTYALRLCGRPFSKRKSVVLSKYIIKTNQLLPVMRREGGEGLINNFFLERERAREECTKLFKKG